MTMAAARMHHQPRNSHVAAHVQAHDTSRMRPQLFGVTLTLFAALFCMLLHVAPLLENMPTASSVRPLWCRCRASQDWRKRVESQRGAILAFETKNNKNKVAKWTAAALLAGADMIKLGYVSRAGPRDNANHVILATQVREREAAKPVSERGGGMPCKY